jgi:hypothetical protein
VIISNARRTPTHEITAKINFCILVYMNFSLTICVFKSVGPDIKIKCCTYCTRNGKNGASSFIAKDGRISASRIAPVEVGLHSRVELSATGKERSPFNKYNSNNVNIRTKSNKMIYAISQ